MVVVIPPNALTVDAVVSIKTEDPGTAGLPADFKPVGDVIGIGPSNLFFATPATLTLPVPDDLPAGTVMALVEIAPELESAQRLSSARFEKRLAAPVVNVRRMALGLSSSEDRAVAAAVNLGKVECLGAQNMRGGSAVVSLVRSRRFIAAAVPESSCTGSAATPFQQVIPSNSIVPCRENEYADEALGQNPLQSRHVHCGKNETELGWLDGPNGNYGRFKLEWRIGSDGAPKLSKNYRIKLRLTQLEAPQTTPATGSLRLTVKPVFECFGQQYTDGSCSHSQVTGSVTAGQGWSSEILVPVNFQWSGGSNTFNEFGFGQINLIYSMPGGGTERNVYLSGVPRVRCDKQMAVNGGSGCVYHDAPAVFVLSANDSKVSEAAAHIRDAQAWGALGGLHFDAEGQALASPGNALHRTRVRGLKGYPEDGANRRNSCGYADAIINIRPQASASCTSPGAACDCDEYPFNSTWNGGWLNKDWTSARKINLTQNREAGRRLQSFYQSERVLDYTPDPGIVFTLQNAPQSIPARIGGDDFWVHVE